MTALVLLLAAAPVDARFVLEVSGFPLAELHVRVDGEQWIYEATHFLEEGPRVKRLELPLRNGTPEVLALMTPPTRGCQDVIEERTGAVEKLCVATRTATTASGTLDAQPFTARYAEGGLREITVGSATWRRVSQPTAPPRDESPFIAGVPAPGLTLSPPVAGAKWLAKNPRGTGAADDLGRTRCLVLARRAVKEQPGARVSVGLVVENGRAYPHAWVTTASGAEDPSVLPDDEVLTRRRYLEVPLAKSGDFYLRLFDGAVQLR